MFHNTKPERLTSAKQSNLLGQFVSYEENEVLWIRTRVFTANFRLTNDTATYYISVQITREKVLLHWAGLNLLLFL